MAGAGSGAGAGLQTRTLGYAESLQQAGQGIGLVGPSPGLTAGGVTESLWRLRSPL